MVICRRRVDALKLQQVKLNKDPGRCALQILGGLFIPEGVTNSKDEVRCRSIKYLDSIRMMYIQGISKYVFDTNYMMNINLCPTDYIEEQWLGQFKKLLIIKKLTQNLQICTTIEKT